MKTMKALVKKKSTPGLWLDEIPVPEIGINDVLIEVLRTGICGTDVHIFNWDAWAQKTIPVPMAVGHEFVGKIARVGDNVHDFSVGDIVSGAVEIAWREGGIFVKTPRALASIVPAPLPSIWRFR
jgi:threonine 3-dehydrogenase